MENKCSDPDHSALAIICCMLSASCSAPTSVCSALLLLSAFLLCFCYLFFTIYFLKRSVCSSFRLLCSHTFHSSFLPYFICSALPALLGRSARRGGYPFSKKRSLSFLPPKIPAIFSKTSPPTHLHLTHHILRTVSHLASYHSDGITFSAIHLERYHI